MSYTNFVNGAEPPLSGTILNNMQVELMKLVFPIGSTYTTQNDTNPSTILNFGTWERVKGKVLVGLDEDDEAFNTIGKKGGEKTHKLTVDELPSHQHDIGYDQSANGGTEWLKSGGDTGGPYWDSKFCASTGGNQPHNILQPYQVIGYMWIRTA